MSAERPRIDQLCAGFAQGDAISQDALILRGTLHTLGYAADIFAPAARIAPDATAMCRPLDAWRPGPRDVAILHYAIASDVNAAALAHAGRKVLIYHNITPATFFDGVDPAIAADLRRGREALPGVLRGVDAAWADSQFNASELQPLTALPVKIFPLAFAPAAVDVPPDPAVLAQFAAPMTNILFVGRIAPNKCVEDLLQAFAHYHRACNPRSRLILAGSQSTAPRYYTMLRMLARDLGLTTVCFTEFASPAGLSAYYAVANLFVVTSRHEGYCLPLVEAMHKGIPVLARATGGIPEALDGAGVMYDGGTPAELAELMHRMLSDEALRAEVLASQAARLARLRARDLKPELAALLAGLV